MPNLHAAAFIRDVAVRYLWTLLGLPYAWSGDDSVGGYDCSGLVMEILKAVGLENHKTDKTADQLWLKYSLTKVDFGCAGCLVFWFNADGRAIHVEMMANDLHVIGASGGGSKTLTREDAIRHNAYVKLRPIGYRGMDFKIADPFGVVFNG